MSPLENQVFSRDAGRTSLLVSADPGEREKGEGGRERERGGRREETDSKAVVYNEQ